MRHDRGSAAILCSNTKWWRWSGDGGNNNIFNDRCRWGRLLSRREDWECLANYDGRGEHFPPRFAVLQLRHYCTILLRTFECYLLRNMRLNMSYPPSTNFKVLRTSKAPFLNINVKIGEHHHLVVYAALLEGTTDIFRRFLGMDWWWWLRLRQLKCTFSELLQTQFLCSFTRTMRFPLNYIGM